jgi:phenylacetate-coenzyme A ligase PaaK-like adenylate-forming protein
LINNSEPILDIPIEDRPEPDEIIRSAMRWHFGEETGSRFWLARAKTLDFDPVTDVKGIDDLALFPNVCDELRDVPVADLIPRGYGEHPTICGIFESGGTTGPPKRVVLLPDWFLASQEWLNIGFDGHGLPRGANWLTMVPSGPHMVGYAFPQHAMDRGGLAFTIDLDPRWVKKLVADGRAEEAGAYVEHLLEQARLVLRNQDIGVLTITPPMLERLAMDDELVELVQAKVKVIMWAGAHLDPDTRHLLGTEVFPEITLIGFFGSTMVLGGSSQRVSDDRDLCVFDPPSPFITYRVVNPDTGTEVDYGQRGDVVISHVSRSFLLPNNRERDQAIRTPGPPGQAGDSLQDVAPVRVFDGATVIEGVY